MEYGLRKVAVSIEEVMIEGGKAVPSPYRTAIAAAVIRNPWAGRGFVENLMPEILAIAPPLGDLLVPRLLDAVGGADMVEAYGKSAVVGLNGEVEQGSALIHTLRFGNKLRDAVKGANFIPFSNKRASAGCTVDIPLTHINKTGERSHFLTATLMIPDAPGPDEILVAIGAAISGRPHARIGDRFKDMEEMGVDQTGAARSD